MRKAIASLAALLIGTSVLVYTALPASAAEPSRFVTVTGVGTTSVTPDAVRFYASVSALGKSNKEALSTASKSANSVRSALKSAGIATKDIKTSALSVYPEYNYTQDRGQELVGYRATQSFTVVVKKAENAGVVIDSVVDAGGDAVQINGVAPFLSDGAAATRLAREAAVADAKSRASTYARLLGERLGRVISVTEQSAPNYAFPVMMAGKAADESTQIDLGETEVSVSITVSWELN